jgi:hypothetical protein
MIQKGRMTYSSLCGVWTAYNPPTLCVKALRIIADAAAQIADPGYETHLRNWCFVRARPRKQQVISVICPSGFCAAALAPRNASYFEKGIHQDDIVAEDDDICRVWSVRDCVTATWKPGRNPKAAAKVR